VQFRALRPSEWNSVGRGFDSRERTRTRAISQSLTQTLGLVIRRRRRQLIRLRRRFETIELRDAIPEILFLNSHDGTSAYLRWVLVCHHATELRWIGL
jgi:hypothetical protein